MGQINKQNQNQETTDTPELQRDHSPFETANSIQSLRMRQILDTLTSGVSALVAAIDVNYQYIYFSQAYSDEVKRLGGINLRTGMTVMDVYRDMPEQLAFSLKQWNRSIQGEVFKDVVKFLRSEGDENFYEVTYSPIKDDNDVATGAVLVAKNITRRLDLEHSLTEGEMRYQQLFDHIFEGLAICELLYDAAGQPTDYRVLDVNPNFTHILGSTREQLIGSTYFTSNHALELLSLDRLSRFVFTGNSVHFEEFSAVHERYYDVFVYSLANNCFAILLSGITERKSEQDHRDYLASFPEQNPLPVVEVDYEGKFIYLNPAAHKFFPELGGIDGTQHFQDKIIDIIAKYQAGEYSVLSKNVLVGNTWLHLSFYHMPQLNRIRIYSVDITERINAENELIYVNRKLEKTVTQRTKELNRLNQELTVDILRRKDSENALEAERKRFNNVLEVLPVYVLLVTPDGQIIFANKFFEDTFNCSRTDPCTELALFRNNPAEIN